ncbi:hypothetical protein RFI_06543 [Reticulomyxa filosa]|uniref:Uncharacterized protein n=1 Tax=Reticulomyxa filosa TaxID=46433 RepID=X6NZ70_RETFI|nr:hypothetical protein RFI_06543 [Reticulomyxa filosa]|eukprot:ETO30577.1 hypothetical protein RFI_06543 [Reticulomyxa filosa]
MEIQKSKFEILLTAFCKATNFSGVLSPKDPVRVIHEINGYLNDTNETIRILSNSILLYLAKESARLPYSYKLYCVYHILMMMETETNDSVRMISIKSFYQWFVHDPNLVIAYSMTNTKKIPRKPLTFNHLFLLWFSQVGMQDTCNSNRVAVFRHILQLCTMLAQTPNLDYKESNAITFSLNQWTQLFHHKPLRLLRVEGIPPSSTSSIELLYPSHQLQQSQQSQQQQQQQQQHSKGGQKPQSSAMMVDHINGRLFFMKSKMFLDDAKMTFGIRNRLSCQDVQPNEPYMLVHVESLLRTSCGLFANALDDEIAAVRAAAIKAMVAFCKMHFKLHHSEALKKKKKSHLDRRKGGRERKKGDGWGTIGEWVGETNFQDDLDEEEGDAIDSGRADETKTTGDDEHTNDNELQKSEAKTTENSSGVKEEGKKESTTKCGDNNLEQVSGNDDVVLFANVLMKNTPNDVTSRVIGLLTDALNDEDSRIRMLALEGFEVLLKEGEQVICIGDHCLAVFQMLTQDEQIHTRHCAYRVITRLSLRKPNSLLSLLQQLVLHNLRKYPSDTLLLCRTVASLSYRYCHMLEAVIETLIQNVLKCKPVFSFLRHQEQTTTLSVSDSRHFVIAISFVVYVCARYYHFFFFLNASGNTYLRSKIPSHWIKFIRECWQYRPSCFGFCVEPLEGAHRDNANSRSASTLMNNNAHCANGDNKHNDGNSSLKKPLWDEMLWQSREELKKEWATSVTKPSPFMETSDGLCNICTDITVNINDNSLENGLLTHLYQLTSTDSVLTLSQLHQKMEALFRDKKQCNFHLLGELINNFQKFGKQMSQHVCASLELFSICHFVLQHLEIAFIREMSSSLSTQDIPRLNLNPNFTHIEYYLHLWHQLLSLRSSQTAMHKRKALKQFILWMHSLVKLIKETCQSNGLLDSTVCPKTQDHNQTFWTKTARMYAYYFDGNDNWSPSTNCTPWTDYEETLKELVLTQTTKTLAQTSLKHLIILNKPCTKLVLPFLSPIHLRITGHVIPLLTKILSPVFRVMIAHTPKNKKDKDNEKDTYMPLKNYVMYTQLKTRTYKSDKVLRYQLNERKTENYYLLFCDKTIAFLFPLGFREVITFIKIKDEITKTSKAVQHKQIKQKQHKNALTPLSLS